MRHGFFVGLAALFLLTWWIVLPVMNYHKGTSENITTTIVMQPFLDGPNLVYRWSGDIVRSCPVEIRRVIIDSDNVVTNLIPRVVGGLPVSELGQGEYEVSVPVPSQIAEGPAQYMAIEIPSCSWLQRLRPVAIPYPPVDFVVTR